MSPRSAGGKTAPRLLHDLTTYDPRYEARAGRNLLTTSPPHFDPNAEPTPAVPYRNCRHNLMLKPEQSQEPNVGLDPQYDTVYKVASFCQNCRWHIDVVVDFRCDGRETPCSKENKHPLHHFVFRTEDTDSDNAFGSAQVPRVFHFQCSGPQCPVALQIRMRPPRFNDEHISLMTNSARLRQRLETAKQLAGERADANMARPVDALDFLTTYLTDALKPQPGKGRIPLLNRKFLKTFGKDCDNILTGLGFSHAVEKSEEGEEAQVWHLPRPPPAGNPLDVDTERTVIEDARYELGVLLLGFPENERVGIRNSPVLPHPAIKIVERALGCEDYGKKAALGTRNSDHEEDHPYYAGLGTVGDFSDDLLLFAYNCQFRVDKDNATYYFECLQSIAIGRNSEWLNMEVMTLASKGQVNRAELRNAYQYFGINPRDADYISDEHVLQNFRSRLPDIGPGQDEEARNVLRIIGNARNSDRLRQEASNAFETYEQAMSWLGLDENQADDFVITMYSMKKDENGAEVARKAVEIIAEARNSEFLRDYLRTGELRAQQMDVGEAYALLGISNRTERLDPEILKVNKMYLILDRPGDEAKFEEAYRLVSDDQSKNPGLSLSSTRPAYPLETWPVGCLNIGNTCYLNSVLQFLFTIKPLRNMVLDCEQHLQTVSQEALEGKRVGRSDVTVAKVEQAQRFIHELRNLFQRMVTANTSSIRPEIKLAALALSKDADLNLPNSNHIEDSGLGELGGEPVFGPMPAPETNDSAMKEDNSDSSSTVAEADTDGDHLMEMNDLVGEAAIDEGEKPPLPNRPPPIPPRPQDMKKIESLAQQQDAAEILNNVFDLLSCAIQGEGVLDDGEQQDLVKRLFFSSVTAVRNTNGTIVRKSDLQDNHLISPGNRDRPLYAALDDEFSLSEQEPEMKDGKAIIPTKYEVIDHASPVLIINVRRLVYEGGRSRKDTSHVQLDDLLYLDRYLKQTKSLSEAEVLELRERQWELRRKLRELEARKKELKETEVKTDLAAAVEETATLIEDFTKADDDQLIDVDDDPLPRYTELADGLKERAKELEDEAKALDERLKDIDGQVDGVFDKYRDHGYRLHSIFMHRGGPGGGHYWIYIYDFQEKIWREYNDERVSKVEDPQKSIFEQEEKYPGTSTGVVYVQEDMIDGLTEAVHRVPEPLLDQDVEMGEVKDTDYSQVQVIDGIEAS
ncbi:cysteine proteinase [Aaosphaeria arxii CBS 175.79]|uniref:ubiquitinyl hydrolase 1 n=1 Tax=Aaosphaeria arxii CBS 175.79 TaxID=1450172 RepID=A0A6A5XG07_9PLEO|nr:cysteine proteinase [Aaosphaeria arxii CBS 175.79]KAF2011767.1 cysteine proteinase [Aaosphaeria arxii CBS 175.79]